MPGKYVLDAHYEAVAQELVASGRYASVNDLLLHGVHLVAEQEALRAWKLAELKKAIQEGLDSGFEDYTDSEDVKLEGRRILAERESKLPNNSMRC